MSHHNRKRDFMNYWRLLGYAKPYKWRLTIGILAGFIASSSLFGGLLMIPYLMKGVDSNRPENVAAVEKTATQIVQVMERETEPQEKVKGVSNILAGPQKQMAERIVQSTNKQGATEQEKIKTVASILLTPDNRGELEKKLLKADEQLNNIVPASWNMHISYRNGDIVFTVGNTTLLDLPAETASGSMTWQFFSIFVAGFVFLWVIRNLFIFINNYYTRWVGTKVSTDMRDEAFRKMMNQSMRFYGQIDVGQLISRSTNDTGALEAAITNSIADATRCPLEILACFAAILLASFKYNNWLLAVILFIGLPLCVLPIMIIARKIRKIYRRSFSQIADVVTRMHEVLSGIIVVKAYHAENREVRRFEETNARYFNSVNRALKMQLFMAPLMETVAVGSTLVFFVFSYSQGVTLTELAQLLTPCFLAYAPIKALAKISAQFQRSMAAADRYFQLIDIDTSLHEKENPVAIREFKNEIRFTDVVFAYDQKKILDGINLAIPKGHVVAVVGETGSGKTTIANLIARFYDVNSGKVTIDGIDLRDVKTDSLRDLIGIVSQDAVLFNDTIANNIAYGVPDASREEIIQAAKQANADRFITDGRHKDGYDTIVGEKGFLLSGGEKQRVSIARAILKNPPILILDEATSALDTVTEKLVQDALNKVMANRTVFAIAHRLSTIKNANMIIVLDKGHIVEAGTHEELLRLGGRYKKLHDTQFGRLAEA